MKTAACKGLLNIASNKLESRHDLCTGLGYKLIVEHDKSCVFLVGTLACNKPTLCKGHIEYTIIPCSCDCHK